MRDQDAFELCLKKVRILQSNLGCTRSCWPVEEMLGVHIRGTILPSDKSVPADYVIQFCIIGRRALRAWPARARLFEVYYGQGVPYVETMNLLHLKKGTMDWYLSKIQPVVGRELKQQRLVPGRKFQKELKDSEKEAERLKVTAKATKSKNKRKAK